MKSSRRVRGMTLIELLVVVSVIGLLLAITVRAVHLTRASARRVRCQNNLKQIGLALHSYHDARSGFPSGSIRTRPYAWGFMLYLLPHLEHTPSYQAIDFKLPNCGQQIKNLQAANRPEPQSQLFEFLACPSDPHAKKLLFSGPTGPLPLSGDCGLLYAGDYLGVSGDQESGFCLGLTENNGGNGMLYTHSQTTFSKARDGASHTLLVGERGIPADLGWGWMICGGTECEHYVSTYRGLSKGWDALSWHGTLRRFWSWHTAGAHFVTVDGAVHMVSYDVDRTTFKALSTRANGDFATIDGSK